MPISTTNPLTGPALAAEVENIVFGDDLGCFAADGTERRERIEAAILSVANVEYCGFAGDHFVFPGFEALPFFGCDSESEVATKAWEGRKGKPWQADIEQAVASYRAAPRPFDSDPALALGLLPFNVSITGGEDRYTVYLMDGFYGEAQFTEFPDAPPEQQRVLAFCAAVCRAALNAAKEQADE